MKPAPRPAARVLLAGRFLVPRASLLALPAGPVAGLDLSSGDLVALAFGPAADDPTALAARIGCWNEHARPAIRDLAWHLGRPLVAFDLRPADAAGASGEVDGGNLAARCGALGAVLDAVGLGLACGPADLAVGVDGPWLRRPAIWPADPARPLEQRLHELGSQLAARAPAPAAGERPAARGRAADALARRVPAGRRARIVLLIACCLVSALIVSRLTGSSHGGGVARAAPPQMTPLVPEAQPAPAPRPVVLHPHTPPPGSRGGPARVLFVVPKIVHPSPPVAAIAAPAPPPVAVPPTRGWVAGLFAGS